MLDALRTFLESPDHSDDLSLRIESVTWTDEALELGLAVMDYNCTETWSLWSVRCVGVREFHMVERFAETLEMHGWGHAATRQYTDSHRSLFFNGSPQDVHALIGRLSMAHNRLAEDWIPFDRYFNTECSLIDLLKGGTVSSLRDRSSSSKGTRKSFGWSQSTRALAMSDRQKLGTEQSGSSLIARFR